MPELPEVETVRRGLVPAMEGVVITRAEARRPDLRWPLPAGFAARLSGARVLRLGRRAKYILAETDRQEVLIWHLGMSGRVKIDGLAPGGFAHEAGAVEKHDHVLFHMANGARVAFNDARRFGAMDLTPAADLAAHPLLAALGPEPLGNDFHEDYLIAQFRGRGSTAKALLLDQRVVAGLGNIYVCEALHRAGIDPRRAGGRIAARRVAGLVPVIRDVLSEAIAAGGSTLRDHRQTDGSLGYFQHNFRAYGRENAPCPTPGCGGVIRRITQAGRSTYLCAQCQR